MTVTVNGQARELTEPVTVSDLLRELGLNNAACAVEVNLSIVPKARQPEHPLQDGDRVEIVTLVGGG